MVSVVITILNEAENIEKLLSSLLGQTNKPGEIIIVDGGSTDGTQDIVKKFASQKRIVKLLQKKGNRSVGRNWGIKQAKGRIIAITDAGGYPKEDWLEKIIKPFEDKNVSVVSGYYQAEPLNPFQKCAAPYFLVMPDKVKKGMYFRPSSRSVAIRKEIWRKVPYPEKYSHNEDFVWDIELEKTGYKFHFEPDAIVYWYPPKNLSIALRQFYRFAYGDAEAGISRPKVWTIFLRYLLFAALFPFRGLFEVCIMSYGVWAIIKNYKYVKHQAGFFWLPVIQITSDFAIMLGYIKGKTS